MPKFHHANLGVPPELAESPEIEARLSAAGIPYTAGEFIGNRVVNSKDPAGNGWELRS